jgi:hypothetical protein
MPYLEFFFDEEEVRNKIIKLFSNLKDLKFQ